MTKLLTLVLQIYVSLVALRCRLYRHDGYANRTARRLSTHPLWHNHTWRGGFYMLQWNLRSISHLSITPRWKLKKTTNSILFPFKDAEILGCFLVLIKTNYGCVRTDLASPPHFRWKSTNFFNLRKAGVNNWLRGASPKFKIPVSWIDIYSILLPSHCSRLISSYSLVAKKLSKNYQSIDCVWETNVFMMAKSFNLMIERLRIIERTGQLSIIHTIFNFSTNRLISIQQFQCDPYRNGNDFTFSKTKRFLDLPIPNIEY